MMKKLSALLLVLALVLSMVGCVAQPANNSSTSKTTSSKTSGKSDKDKNDDEDEDNSDDEDDPDGDDEDEDEDDPWDDEDYDDEDEDEDDEGDSGETVSKGPFQYSISDVKPIQTFSGAPFSSVIAQPSGQPASFVPGSGVNMFVPLDSILNADIFSNDKNRRDGAFDESTPYPLIFSSDGLKQIFTFDGVQYKYNDNVYKDGVNNVVKCYGQELSIASAERKRMQCDYIGVIAMAYNGDTAKDFTVIFEDGTFEVTPISVYDWANGTMPDYLVTDGAIPGSFKGGLPNVGNIKPRYGELDVIRGKRVKSVKFPYFNYMYVLAMTMVNAR